MNLKQYIEALNDIISENPEAAEFLVVYSEDDEGNYYDFLSHLPEIGIFNREDQSFTPLDYCEGDEEGVRVVCVN